MHEIHHVNISMSTVKGESLRQQLLMRYCDNGQPFDLVSKDSKNKSSLTRHGIVMSMSVSSPLDSDRGSMQLKRAGMTLHDVQVGC